MRFWDASALVPLFVEEAHSSVLDEVGKEDRLTAVWWGTLVELSAAVERRHRGGTLSDAEREEADSRLATAALSWFTVAPSAAVRREALHLVRVHGLRAGDAFQLAAALQWTGEPPSGHVFVAVDRELRSAAAREGFTVLPP